jgi:Fic family protein
MAYNNKEPYNDLPLLPPAHEIENVEILRKIIDARSSIAELKASCKIIPNPAMLINTIVLQEAKASSEIENIVTTSDSLYKAFSSGKTTGVDSATKEVLRYREAIFEGFNTLKDRKIDKELFIEVVKKIQQNDEGIRDHIKDGTRTLIGNRATGTVVYTPPEGKEVIEKLLVNLTEFLNDDVSVLDPLIKMAIAHYQFEAIHPFSDGNGRTGRIINILFLVQRKLLDLPVLYLSKYINDNKPEYYKRLKLVTENNEWLPWIFYMIEAVKTTSDFTINKINNINELLEDALIEVKTKLPKIYSKELVELLFTQPYSKIDFLVEVGIASRNAAGRYLNSLESIGLLEKHRLGKENLFLNKKLFTLLST